MRKITARSCARSKESAGLDAALRRTSARRETPVARRHRPIVSGRRIRQARGEAIMSSFALSGRVFAGSVLAGLAWAAPTAPAVAQQMTAPPDFSSNQVGWAGGAGGAGAGVRGVGPNFFAANFVAVPGRLPPVANDPAHPFVPNG